MLVQLIYLSQRSKGLSQNDIEDIIKVSQENNKAKDFTGVLLYSETKFLQVLEGERIGIMKLYDTIQKDKRHKEVFLLALISIEKRVFPSWEMAGKDISGGYEFVTEMSEKEADDFSKLLEADETVKEKAIDLIQKFFK